MVLFQESQVPEVLYRRSSLVNIVSTADETEIFNFTVPAGLMARNRCLRIIVLGDHLHSATASSPSFRFKVNGANIYADTCASFTNTSSVRPLRIEAYLCNKNATNSNFLCGIIAVGAAGAASPGNGDSATDEILMFTPFASAGDIALDTASSFTVSATWQHTSSSANKAFRSRFVLAEIL